MADVIRIKRRTAGAPGAPASLANAEIAYNEVEDILYYGKGTGGTGGSATTVIPIGGPGAFAPINSPALTGSPTAPTVTPATDNSTKIATTAFVQSAISAVSSGVTSIAATDGLNASAPSGAVVIGINNNGIANGKLGQMPAHTYKGNNTGSSASPIDLTVAQVMTDLGAAPLNSPGFTGTPTGPTAANGTNNTQLATTAFVLGSRLDQFAAPTIDVSWGNHRITALLDPASAQDAATKAYVDAIAQGLDPKDTADLATTAALPANTYANGTAGVGATLTGNANGALSVDSVAVAAGDILLVKNEAAGEHNGLYVVSNAGSAGAPYVLTRHASMDSANEFSGAFVPVGSDGTVNANTLWLANPSTPVTVGTTTIPFTQLNSATSYVPGNGINIAGNVISAVGVAGRISVGGSGIDIDVAYVGQSSITTLGTITTGTWHGSTIDVAHGGTGATTLTGYVKGNGTSAMTASASIPSTDITGLGTMAAQNANAVAITGGTIDGVELDGGTF
jgi:hypothetical protein